MRASAPGGAPSDPDSLPLTSCTRQVAVAGLVTENFHGEAPAVKSPLVSRPDAEAPALGIGMPTSGCVGGPATSWTPSTHTSPPALASRLRIRFASVSFAVAWYVNSKFCQ